jgi:hypothetical protein
MKKTAVPCGTAEFREETSKKGSKGIALAAMHKLGGRATARKALFCGAADVRYALFACHED